MLDDRLHTTESSHIASTKEVVADDTANSNTDITFRVSQTTLSDFSKNMEEPSPTENEDEIHDQTRSMDSHEIQCEKEYWSDLRADTGTLFLPDKIAMEPHSLTHFSESTLEQGDKEVWIRRVSWRVDQQSRFSEDAGDVDHEHKSW